MPLNSLPLLPLCNSEGSIIPRKGVSFYEDLDFKKRRHFIKILVSENVWLNEQALKCGKTSTRTKSGHKYNDALKWNKERDQNVSDKDTM